MKLKTSLLGFGLATSLMALAGTASACELGRNVKLADGNWDAIQVFNSIAARILKDGYDCEAELVTGAMVPLFTALGKGDVDIFMDVWIPNNQEVWAETMEQGAVELGVMYADATEGWYVPRYVVEGDAERGIDPMAPDLTGVDQLAQHSELFTDPEEPDKGRFLNCPIGWGCEQRNNDKLEAYGLTDSFVNFRPGTGAALDAAYASAHKRGKPVVGYYWEPTWLLGVYDMVKLEEPACTEDNANACAFPSTPASVTASAQFVEEADELESFFANFETSSAEVSALLAFMQEGDGADRDAAAAHFLENYADTWTGWVSEEAAQKIKDAM